MTVLLNFGINNQIASSEYDHCGSTDSGHGEKSVLILRWDDLGGIEATLIRKDQHSISQVQDYSYSETFISRYLLDIAI